MIIHPACPITCGQPTRMAEKAFRRLCVLKQGNEKSYCHNVCHGENLPAELTFIDVAKEIAMATTASGKCLVCGQTKNVKTVRDGKCCANCAQTYHAVHGKHELLLRLLRQVHGEGWLAEHMPKPEPKMEAAIDPINYAADEIVSLREQNDKLREDLDRLRREMAEAEELADMVVAGGARLVFPSVEIASPRKPFEREKDPDQQPVYSGALLEVSQSRADILLDLAIGVIEGRVVGVDANTINLLRQ